MKSWPAHKVETRRWNTGADNRTPGGRRPPRPEKQLAEIEVAVPPTIAEAVPTFDPTVRSLIEVANIAVARLGQQAGAELASLSNFWIRSESVASSTAQRQPG